MSYTVPNVWLVPQDKTNACWYAATQMVINWRRNDRQMCESGILGPSEVPAAVAVYRSNNVLPWASMQRYAKMVGLVSMPLMSPTVDALENWLRQHGPLWCDGVPIDIRGNPVGTGHVVVVSGIRGEGANSEIRIHNPWPPNGGNISWRPISHLSGILSDGANMNRDTCFLRCP